MSEVEYTCAKPDCGCGVVCEAQRAAETLALVMHKTAPDSRAVIRTFDTGATRDVDANKLDFEGCISPLVLKRFSEYMHKNRQMADGSLRDSDNWQKGIPLPAYMKSAWRHFYGWWNGHRHGVDVPERGHTPQDEEDICGVLFNAQGYLHELLKRRDYR